MPNIKKDPSITVNATERTRFSKSRPNDPEDIIQGQGSSHATHPLMPLIICTKYGKNPSWTVDATERTRDAGRTNGRIDVRLQNLPWYKTGLLSRQVLYLLSKLQNWIWPKTGQYKTCLVSNTKIESSIRATKLKPWQSHLTSETVEIFIQNAEAGLMPMQSRFWCGRLSVGTKPVLVQQVCAVPR